MARTKKIVVYVVAWTLFSAVVAAASGTDDAQKLRSDIDQLKPVVEGLKETVGNLTESAQKLRSDIDQLKPVVEGLKETVEKLTESAQKLRSDIDQLKPVVEGLKETVDEIKDTVNHISQKVVPLDELRADVRTIRDRSMDWVINWYSVVLGVLIGVAGIAFGFLKRPRQD